MESDHFAALPTRGAVVPGWLLVVTKQHRLSLGSVPAEQRDELVEFASAVRGVVERAFGPAVAFEHGPVASGLRVGCGVDHAHLHVVPTDADLRAGAAAEFPGPISWTRVGSVADTAHWVRRGQSYLFVEEADGAAWVGTAAELPSQLFRKVIARAVGAPERFDWNVYPELGNVAATVRALAAPAFAGTGTAHA